jgi:hypothetical protein
MSRILLAATLAAGLWLPAAATAQPPEAKPGEIADAWQLQSHGHVVCRLTLSGRVTRGGHYGAEIPEACREALPPGAVGWKPVPDGIALVAADGAVLIAFERWSESLFVAGGPGAPDLQLARAPINHGER